MGKTKTAVVSGMPEDAKSSKDKLREKRKIQDGKKAHITKVGLKGGERIKTVEAGPIIKTEKEETKEEEKKEYKPKIRGKKYKKAAAKIDNTKTYPLSKAIKLVKDTSYSKFNGTVELHMSIKKVGTSVNVKLPYSTGKRKKIEIASDATIEKLKKGKTDFDLLLATPNMMPKLVPFAKILGPKGLMPNPKNGTLIKTKDEAKKFSGNTINIKTEKKAPVIHAVVGKVKMEDKKLIDNVEEIFSKIGKKQITKATITSTMGPGIKVKV